MEQGKIKPVEWADGKVKKSKRFYIAWMDASERKRQKVACVDRAGSD